MPKLRFKGFTDDWEQRKLWELGEILTGSTPSTANEEYYSEDGIPWVTPTDIQSNLISDTPKKLSEEGIKVGRVVPANTILCTCIASIGKNTLLTVRGSFNQQINSLTPNADNDAYFLLTESELWSNHMKKMAAAGTMQIVNKTEFSEIRSMVPKYDEQKKIGAYFRKLDTLITLHQRKCDELKKVKKYMLQKMFPKKGEKVPEIRLAGFTGDWEQRKLGDIAECLDNMRIPLNAEEREKISGDIPYYGAGNIQGYINKHLFEEDLVLLLEDGDAFDDYQTKSIAQYVTGKSWVNNHAHVLRPLGDSYFLYSTLAHKDIRQWTQLAGASRKKLVQEAMLNIDIAIPNKDEQNKVGNVFRELDNLIVLHQRKHETLKEIKKYMLQNMFPKK